MLKLPKGAMSSNDMRREAEYFVVAELYKRFARVQQRRFVLFRTFRYRLILSKIRRAIGG